MCVCVCVLLSIVVLGFLFWASLIILYRLTDGFSLLILTLYASCIYVIYVLIVHIYIIIYINLFMYKN